MANLPFKSIEKIGITTPNPIPEPIERNLTITGKVYDLTTSGFGKNLKVCICDTTNNKVKIIASTYSQKDGSYYITMDKTHLARYAEANLGFKLEFFVFQGRNQLVLEKNEEIVVESFNKTALKHIYAYTLPSIKGILKRKNGVPAVNCRVELYRSTNNNCEGFDITGSDGEYEIPYKIDKQDVRSSRSERFYLKFYNNEDILKEVIKIVFMHSAIHESKINIDTFSFSTVELETRRIYEINELIVKTDTKTGDKYYYIVNENSTPRLVYCKNHKKSKTRNQINYYRVVNNFMILEKRIEYDNSENSLGKLRTIWTRRENDTLTEKSSIVGKILLRENLGLDSLNEREASDSSKITYIKEIEYYKASRSPQIIPKKYIENVNFLFSTSSIDLYTSLTKRKDEVNVEFPEIINQKENLNLNQN